MLSLSWGVSLFPQQDRWNNGWSAYFNQGLYWTEPGF